MAYGSREPGQDEDAKDEGENPKDYHRNPAVKPILDVLEDAGLERLGTLVWPRARRETSDAGIVRQCLYNQRSTLRHTATIGGTMAQVGFAFFDTSFQPC